jgi:hypothetical protein
MSTTTSPPPPPQQGHLAAFNQRNFDPYLPSSPDDEQLTEVPTSHNTPGSSFRAESHQDTDSGTYRPQYLSTGSASGLGDSPFSEYTHASGGMSPTSFEEQLSTLEAFDDNSLLYQNFAYGDLPAPENPQDTHIFNSLQGVGQPSLSHQQEPTSATTYRSNLSRQSTGIADLSEHLMSPVLTDMPSPESGNEGVGSVFRAKMQERDHSIMDAAYHTPAATGSSVDLSPNPSAEHHGFTSAPRVRIESYSRGDSPARVGGIKRSRAGSHSGSHLAAPRHGSDAESDEHGADHEDDITIGRGGVGPSTRHSMRDANVTSLEDQEKEKELQTKSNQIGDWLSTSEVQGAPPEEIAIPEDDFLKPVGFARRIRSHSSNNARDLHLNPDDLLRSIRAETEARQLGPGKLLDEESDEEYGDSDYGSSVGAAPSVNMHAEQEEAKDSFPAFESERETDGRLGDASPWADPIYFPSQPGTKAQPDTATAAMTMYLKRSKDFDNASRVATWGTIPRRLSDGDMQRVFGNGGLLSRLSINKDNSKDADEDRLKQFKNTVEQAAQRIPLVRALSTSKHKQGGGSRPGSRQNSKDSTRPEHGRKESLTKLRKESSQSSSHTRHDSLGSSSLIDRIPSVRKRPKSPGINTNVAAGLANATQIGFIGVKGGPKSPSSVVSPGSTWDRFANKTREKLGRHSSQDTQEFFDLRSQSANQSRTSLVQSPPPELGPTSTPPVPQVEDEGAESDGIAPDDNKPVKMEMSPSKHPIIPTFDGFKTNIRDVNPRLDAWLVDRLGAEQLRRYKKLSGFKVDHFKAKEGGHCQSGSHCEARGNEVTYFQPRAAQKEPVHSHTGFTVQAAEDEEDAEAVADGVVTEAQFPPGVPMPPPGVKRLPAEFECPLCFQVKKFTKPSDWSKHVHEDLQPFTCTFKNCPDPKSFKRKADWVRHENERHRQLEWWQCTEEGCQHLCYRRDNFVQHLVREHKLPEPKSKSSKPNKPAVRGPAKSKVKARGADIHSIPVDEKVLYMVEVCRHETPKNAMHEPCQFCGNVCNSFKKLTVHLARHMETLALPVLDLVKQKQVDTDTIVSPIDIKLPQHLSPTEQTQFPPHPAFSQPEYPGGFTPVVTGAQFPSPSLYQAQGSWTGPPTQTPRVRHTGPITVTSGIDSAWIPAGNQHNTNYGSNQQQAQLQQQQYNGMMMHHNSVPNPAYYNISAQGQGMPGGYAGSNYAAMGQRPSFTTPQYMGQVPDQSHLVQPQDMSQGQGQMEIPTTQPQHMGMMTAQYDTTATHDMYNDPRSRATSGSPSLQQGQQYYGY